MDDIARLFGDHPQSVGETYLEHLAAASGFGLRMVAAGLACLVHGIFPFLFVKTGSRAIAELYGSMVANRMRPRPRHGWNDAGVHI